jgi:hypothetical protein
MVARARASIGSGSGVTGGNSSRSIAPVRAYDLELGTTWIASQPGLLELVEKAYEVRYGPEWREILADPEGEG